MKKLRKRTIVVLVILIIFIALVITAGVLVYKNKNTLIAMYYTFSGQSVKIEQMKEDSDKKAIDAIKDFGIEDVRPLTEEETEALNKGELSEEDAVNLILGKTDSDKAADVSDGQNDNTSEPTNSQEAVQNGISAEELKEKNDEIAALIGKLYVLKATFSNDLKEIETWVNQQYHILCEEFDGSENIPSSVKTKVGRDAYARALALEADCDSQVGEILNRVNVLLKETNQNSGVVDEIKKSYENEKMAAKSYYMSLI